MASCSGKLKSAATCGSVVHRCKKCMSIGCDQVAPDECSEQGFRLGTCVKCGAIGLAQEQLQKARLVVTPQLEKAMKILKINP
jgi:hypothetical protein